MSLWVWWVVGAVGGMGARVWVLVCSRGLCMVAVAVMVVVLVAAVVGKLLVRRWMWLNMGVLMWDEAVWLWM